MQGLLINRESADLVAFMPKYINKLLNSENHDIAFRIELPDSPFDIVGLKDSNGIWSQGIISCLVDSNPIIKGERLQEKKNIDAVLGPVLVVLMDENGTELNLTTDATGYFLNHCLRTTTIGKRPCNLVVVNHWV